MPSDDSQSKYVPAHLSKEFARASKYTNVSAMGKL